MILLHRLNTHIQIINICVLAGLWHMLAMVMFCCGESSEDSKCHLFITLQSTNSILVVATVKTNMPPADETRHLNLKAYGFEDAFGERWILEGWGTNSGNRIIFYNSYDYFSEKERFRQEACKMPSEELNRLLNSTNAPEREYASIVRKARWSVGGGSRRLVERASDVARIGGIDLVREIPITNIWMFHKNKLRYLQLRIEPVGTNQIPVLLSNIIDLQEPIATNHPRLFDH